MNYKTHLTVGVATALAVSRPHEFGALALCISGAAMGAVLPDIDSSQSKPRKEFQAIILFVVVAFSITMLGELILKLEIFHKISTEFLLGLVSLALFSLLGMQTSHRTFTHSIVGIAVFTGCISFVSTLLIVPFASGMISHVVLDFLNKKKVKILYPYKKWGIGLHLCYSDGKCAKIIGWCSLMIIFLELIIFGKSIIGM